MAGEFTKRTEDGQNIWTCVICSMDIVSAAKPRRHACAHSSSAPETSTTTTPATTGSRVPTPMRLSTPTRQLAPSQDQNAPLHSHFRFSTPPPGFPASQNPRLQNVGGQSDAAALLQFQVFQADQTKQMMMFMQQQNQEMMNMQKEQTQFQMNQMMEMLSVQKKTETKVKCPKWEKDENVKNFLSRLRRWNEVEKGKGKYLQLLEALSESNRTDEKQRIELEEQNGFINPEAENIITDIIEKMNNWFGKTKVDEASEAWREFKNILRARNENIDPFLLRFETAESKLKNSSARLPGMILALHLLETANLEVDQRRNILVHVKIDDEETVYEEMKSALRLLKGSLVEGIVPTTNDEENDGQEEVNFNKNESFKRFRARSRSKPRLESRSFQGERSRERSENRNRGRSRNRYYERTSPGRYRSNSRSRGRDQSYRRNRSFSRDGYNNQRESYEHVNLVFKETGEEAEIEANENVEKMIVDSGTTKTVAGAAWMRNYLKTLTQNEKENIRKHPEKRFFRFGNSSRYPSREEFSIPFKLGKLNTDLHVSVVEASIPLLLGKPDLKRFGFIIDFETETVFISKTFETFGLETTLTGHLALPIKEKEHEDDSVFLIKECDPIEKQKKIVKIHKILAHPKAEVLKLFFKNSSDNDDETLKIVEEVSDNCEVCKRFKKSPNRPKVGLPTSSDFNEVVALDLKERNNNKEYILYCICTFSRLTRGVIIKDKKPDTIVKGIIDCWVLGKGIGPGIPGKFLFDNGGEFNNSQVIDLAEKYGIKMHGTTAAHSPFSNGLCERNHEIVDRMMGKMMADDKNLKATEALDHSLFAKNIEPNNKGFSPFQIVYGNNPSVPGISNSTPPSLSTNFASEDVRNHIQNINKAREAFRAVDNDERIKRALKSRISSYTEEHFQTEDKVYFKENDKIQWSGPGTVIGQQGKIVFLKYGNQLRRVHISRVIPVGNEFKKVNEVGEEKDIKMKPEDVTKDLPPEVEADEKIEEKEPKEPRPKRRASIRRPEKSRKILLKPTNSTGGWRKALVTDVGKKAGTSQFVCTLLLENSDQLIVDFSDQIYEWEYEQFPCDLCEKTFETKRSLRLHATRIHKRENTKDKQVLFTENTFSSNNKYCEKEGKIKIEPNLQSKNDHETDKKEVSKRKVRFKEILDERNSNEEWKEMKAFTKDEEDGVLYNEITETETNSKQVMEAKEKELSKFDEYKAYEEVQYNGQKVLGTRYVLTEKPDGSIKARFVTKGFQEQFPYPSDSPTTSRETIKLFLAIAANEGWAVESSDVSSAFLQSDNIDRDIFIQPPPEREKQGMVWKLLKPCYGLDDASRKWFLSFKSCLLDLGFRQSKREICLFYYMMEEKLEGFLMFHVDDVLSAGSEKFLPILEKLRAKYKFGRIERRSFVFTGLNIHQDENMEITVDQSDFIEQKLEINEYEHGEPQNLLNEDENRLIRKSQGQLSWLATQTRPDISFDAFQLSTVLNRATQKDGKAANKIIKKVKQEDVKLKFRKLGNIKDLHIELFSDASLGNIEQGIQVKSGMGYFICLANENLDISPLHWKSCVIDKVAEDVKTAETLALEKALDDAIHISNLITEIYTGEATQNSIPIIANEDSKSLLESIYSTKKVKRKTMRVVISSIQQHLQDKILTDIHHVKSEDNIADIFTKAGVKTDRILTALESSSLFLQK